MQRTRGSKFLSLFLSVILVLGIFQSVILSSTVAAEGTTSDYTTFISELSTLEGYADKYVSEHTGEEAAALVINYIRCGVEKYTTGTWTTFCGEEKTAFTNYVASQDEANSTTAGDLRDLEILTLPNGNSADMEHLFGAMDMAYHTGNQKTTDLGSWAGDICDLLQLTTNAGITGTVEEMATEIRTNNDKYFLYDDPNAHSFGILDLYGDLDSYYILSNLTNGKKISTIMSNYYTTNLTDSIRAMNFLDGRFSGKTSKEEIRAAVYDTYISNEGIKTLEGTYLPDGVNADIREACCYAFADYLYETAKDRLSNSYYDVFSSETSTLAPGVTQEKNKALTADDKQIVYYVASMDVSRDDVKIYANYNNNDGSTWGMSRVSDQMAAAQTKHSDSTDTDNYIANYNTILGVNGDFYDMSTGQPEGALVMEGTEYSDINDENFFGILKDGTPIIGGSTEWNANKDNIEEAIGGNSWLVRDGKSTSSGTDYYNSRAPRTCVGITYDGRVIMMVIDGRQEPLSAGGAFEEIAQIMIDAGCVTAINLDGGGSTTYAAKEEGTDEVAVVNSPSDGYERSVSTSLLVVSTAKPSTVLDHAIVSADYDYLTVGTSLDISASGVTSTGSAIDLPDGTILKVSDDTIGTISDNSVFTANALGDVVVQLYDPDGTTLLGTKTLHVVEPTDLKFTKETINAVYSEATELPLEATYNGNTVKINSDDVQFGFIKTSLKSIGSVDGGTVNTTVNELVYEYPEAGTITDFSFTGNESGGLRTVTLGAMLKSKVTEIMDLVNSEYLSVYNAAITAGDGEDKATAKAQNAAVSKALEYAAQTKIYLYESDEANFDFSQATGGDSLLAWKREVSNSEYKSERNTYYMTDPSEDMDISYTFAVDMSKVSIPDKLSSLLYMLPGGDQEGRTAWDFLLQLAERISPLTTVTVTLTVPDGFTIDTTDLRLANEYFDMTSATVDGNTLTVVCNYREQTEAINPTTANPLCVISGLKLIPTDGAAWDSDNNVKFEATGVLSYDIYAHFHSLKSLAEQEEFQTTYGLYQIGRASCRERV